MSVPVLRPAQRDEYPVINNPNDVPECTICGDPCQKSEVLPNENHIQRLWVHEERPTHFFHQCCIQRWAEQRTAAKQDFLCPNDNTQLDPSLLKLSKRKIRQIQQEAAESERQWIWNYFQLCRQNYCDARDRSIRLENEAREVEDDTRDLSELCVAYKNKEQAEKVFRDFCIQCHLGHLSEAECLRMTEHELLEHLSRRERFLSRGVSCATRSFLSTAVVAGCVAGAIFALHAFVPQTDLATCCLSIGFNIGMMTWRKNRNDVLYIGAIGTITGFTFAGYSRLFATAVGIASLVSAFAAKYRAPIRQGMLSLGAYYFGLALSSDQQIPRSLILPITIYGVATSIIAQGGLLVSERMMDLFESRWTGQPVIVSERRDIVLLIGSIAGATVNVTYGPVASVIATALISGFFEARLGVY